MKNSYAKDTISQDEADWNLIDPPVPVEDFALLIL